MALYTFSVDAVALVAATAKTILELGTSASDRAKIVEWWIEFHGILATDVPVKCDIGRFSATVTTATTGTADKSDEADGTPSTVVRHSTTVEGAGTINAGIPIHRIPPTTGLWPMIPMGREKIIPVSAFWRIRLTAAAAVNCTVGVTWEE